MRHKFKIEATSTELQTSEAFKLAGFWEKAAKSPSYKTTVQQSVMKISLGGAGASAPPKSAEKKTEAAATPATATNKYEPAPADDINSPKKAAVAPAVVVTDAQKLAGIEKECGELQKKITAMKSAGGSNEGQWVNAKTKKPTSSGAVSMVQLVLAFLICVFLGMHLNKSAVLPEPEVMPAAAAEAGIAVEEALKVESQETV